MNLLKSFPILAIAFSSIGLADPESRILSESPDKKYAVHDDHLVEFPGKTSNIESESSNMFLVEIASGKRVLELPWTKYRNPHVAWNSDSTYVAVAENTRSSYLECYHKIDNENWKKCENEDKELPKLLSDLNVALDSLAFDRSGNLCLLIGVPNERDYDQVEKMPRFCDISVFRYAAEQNTLKLLDRKSQESVVPLTEAKKKMREVMQKYEGGIFPLALKELDEFRLSKKMDSQFQMGYYITDAIGNLNVLKIADVVPGATEKFTANHSVKNGERLLALLAPVKEGLKPKLFLVRKSKGKCQSANLVNDKSSGYVETAKDLCFDDDSKLYLFCDKPDVYGKAKLSIVKISWEYGIQADVISEKIVPIDKKQKVINQMIIDTHNANSLNLSFPSLGVPD